MGSTVSRPANSSVSTKCSSNCLCNKMRGLRSRWLGSPTTMGRQSSAIATERRQMGLNDNDAFAVIQKLYLTNLSLTASNVRPSVFDYVAMQTHLRSLTLKNIENDAQVHLPFLMNIPHLETLVIDNCPGLVAGGFHVLLALPRLRNLVLGIETLEHMCYQFCVQCAADVSLILYKSRLLDDPPKIRAFKNLVSLKFIDFSTMEYPLWVKNMGKLQSLSFHNGTVKESHEDYTVFFPTSLTHFSSRYCKLDRRIVDAILYNGDLLHTLELDLPYLTADIPICFCTNLRTLKISAVECDGDVLNQLFLNKHLRIVDLSGCLTLEAENLTVLRSLGDLYKVVIANSCVRQGCCSILASLHNLRSLEFYYTLGIDLTELANANNLRCLTLVKCIDPFLDLDDFMASDLIKRLESFKIEF